MEQRISLITLGVTDLARSRYFYEHGLRWQPSSASNEQVAFFQTGGMGTGSVSWECFCLLKSSLRPVGGGKFHIPSHLVVVGLHPTPCS
jgi:hypothetical protein